ncbi:MAG: carboxypeptidase regulatory-like domain-containing protein [Deltaproteobacteria bacterium]|nr:carboxypeptidase regulatory-like domain-containing protein [Deltaproteobacteria bacterium]
MASTSRGAQAPQAPLHVSGTVVEASGAPVADARIHSNQTRPPTSALTRADGSFELDLPLPGSIAVSARAHRFTVVAWETLSQSPPGAIRIVLPRSAAVSGTLGDSDGDPAVGASVALTIQPFEPHGARAVEIQAQLMRDGRWDVSDVQPGRITLRARSKEGDEAILLAPFELREGEDKTLDLRLESFRDHPSNTIEGLVVDEAGWPLADVGVEVRTAPRYGAAFLTDAYGRFLLDGLEPGLHTVSAHAPGRMNVDVPGIRTGRRDLTIVLPPRGELVMRVVDRESGAPILNLHRMGRTVRSADGVFRFQLRDEGQKVDIVAQGYEPVSLGPFERPAGRTIDAGTIELDRRR